MTRKTELLSMLALRGVEIGRPFGGEPELTAMDVAAMMRKCSPCECALLRAKYCGEPDNEAWAFWIKHVLDQRWESNVPGRTRDLATAAFDEHMEGLLCRTCGGTQLVIKDGKPADCEECIRGRRHWSGREMARRLGLSRLKTPWAERWEWCRDELDGWERRAVGNLRW